MRVRVSEIYKTIQGESTYAGLPCVMVWLTGCNLDCTYCDTPQAKSGGSDMSVDDIVATVADLNVPLVEVTGGEPLVQEATPLLLNRLLDRGHTVLLETNGSQPLDNVPRDVIKICDIKCPGSGEQDSNLWKNIEQLTDKDQVKFVLSDRSDYDWAKDVIQRHRLSTFDILLSPVTATLSLRELASWILDDGLDARLQPQLHKAVWPEGETQALRPMDRGKAAVVLLSGGLDSATTLALAKRDGFEVYALTFSYGQKHAIEVDSSRKIAETIGVTEHKVVNLDLAPMAQSALTSDQEVPKNREHIGNDIPPTYVPARNLIFLSCAAAWAETLQCGDIFIGVSCTDYSGYPDCRREFLESFQACVNLATKSGVEGRPLTIHAPFLRKTKAEIVRTGLELGLDYSLTHSCYDPGPGGTPCGGCDSCVLRDRAFQEAGLA